MAAHCSSLMRRTSIPIPHAVTSPAPPLHPLQPLQTTCHGAAKSAMTSCSRRGSSLHQSGHPHHICIRQALRQGTSGTAANGKQGTCGLVSRFSTTYSVGHGACLFRRTHMTPKTRAPEHPSGAGAHHLKSSFGLATKSVYEQRHARSLPKPHTRSTHRDHAAYGVAQAIPASSWACDGALKLIIQLPLGPWEAQSSQSLPSGAARRRASACPECPSSPPPSPSRSRQG